MNILNDVIVLIYNSIEFTTIQYRALIIKCIIKKLFSLFTSAVFKNYITLYHMKKLFISTY